MVHPVVLFDVNETLSDLSALPAVFTAVGAPASLAQTWFAATLRDGLALTITGDAQPFATVARPALIGLLAGVEGRVGSAEDAADHVLAAFQELPPHPDVAPGITALTAAGHRVATLSNGSAETADALLDRAGVRGLVEACIGVEHTGVMKPDRRAYLAAVARLGVDPGDAVLVAVHPWDVHGARRAGLRTAFVDRTGTPWPSVFARADVAVPTIDALVDALHGDPS